MLSPNYSTGMQSAHLHTASNNQVYQIKKKTEFERNEKSKIEDQKITF